MTSFSRWMRWMPKHFSIGAHKNRRTSHEVSANSSSAKRRPASTTQTAIALLGQSQRSDRSPEARPDDEDIEVHVAC